MRRASTLLLCAIGAAALIITSAAHAEFYRWLDSRGHIRISNIPPAGVAADGSVLPRYNPSSIAAQRAALRARLAARDAELETESAAQSAAVAVDAPAPDTVRTK